MFYVDLMFDCFIFGCHSCIANITACVYVCDAQKKVRKNWERFWHRALFELITCQVNTPHARCSQRCFCYYCYCCHFYPPTLLFHPLEHVILNASFKWNMVETLLLVVCCFEFFSFGLFCNAMAMAIELRPGIWLHALFLSDVPLANLKWKNIHKQKKRGRL